MTNRLPSGFCACEAGRIFRRASLRGVFRHFIRFRRRWNTANQQGEHKHHGAGKERWVVRILPGTFPERDHFRQASIGGGEGRHFVLGQGCDAATGSFLLSTQNGKVPKDFGVVLACWSWTSSAGVCEAIPVFHNSGCAFIWEE